MPSEALTRDEHSGTRLSGPRFLDRPKADTSDLKTGDELGRHHDTKAPVSGHTAFRIRSSDRRTVDASDLKTEN